ncbi:MAG: type I-C CRISPR-associated protein Cas8c/Csd1 [Desulfobacterium sp.]|jgi:CRISPR-associated protein Csd1|nr:type I-C CRISPR-associated protein Cas8c/Csd1 [Desulfobacterium sp.]MDY0376024.1 type I-C CRISPR-associated protein Cas8c/Csd1 [Desulfobacterium sp.]
MILQTLYDYYERKAKLGEIAPVGWIKKEIGYLIEINEHGECMDVSSMVEFDERTKKFLGKPIVVPCIGKQALKHTNSGVDTNFLWDNTAFVLGRYPEGSADTTIKKKIRSRNSFYELTKKFNKKANIKEVSAVVYFLEKLQNEATNLTTMNFIVEKLTNNELSSLDDRLLKVKEKIKRLKKEKADKENLTAHKKIEKNLTKELVAKKKSYAGFLNGQSSPAVSFRIYGESKMIFELPEVKKKYSDFFFPENKNDDKRRRCLITGKLEEIEPKHLVIKGVKGAQSSGSAIISFNNEALCSYGFNASNKKGVEGREGLNAQVGKPAASKYIQAINTLLSSENNHVDVGGTSFLFWAQKETEIGIEKIAKPILAPPKDNPDSCTKAVRQLYESIHSGKLTLEESKRFYILGLSAPSKARITVRHWQNVTVGAFARNLKQHFDDLKIINSSADQVYDSLSALLAASSKVAGKKMEPYHIWHKKMRYDVSPNLSENVINSILQNQPYPQTLLHSVIRRIRAEQNKKINDRSVPNVTRTRAAIIKACINRFNRFYHKKEEELTVSLDKTNKNPAYLLGRLFAVLERVQRKALGIETIRERYYGAFSSTPVTVFPQLMKLKNHHLAKMDSGKNFFENLIGEIVDGLDGSGIIPRQFSLEEQGKFAVGYYHQRQDLRFKGKKTENNIEKSEEITNE